MAKKKSKKSDGAAVPAKKPAKAAKTAKTAAVVAPAPSPAKAAAAAPTDAQISARAHQIWIGKGSPKPGTPLADWLQAERELRA